MTYNVHLQHLAVRAQKRIARNPQKREKKPDPDLIITTKKNAETTPTPHPQHHRPARTHQPAPPTKQQPTPFLHQKTRNKPKSNPKTKNNPEQAAPQNHPAFSTKNSNILNTHIPHKRQNPEPAEKRRETKTTQLPPQEKDIALLMQLGLTASEARAYLAFIRTGASQIGSLAKTTGIRREHLYQIVHSLENKGLIQKELGPTSKYKAVSLDETLPMLVKRKQTQIAELQTEAQTLIEQFKKRNQPTTNATKELQEETSQFVIIPGTETVIHRLKEALQKTQTSLDVVTSQERFSPAILEFAPAYKKALERGVKIRIATEKHAAEKAAIETVHNLMKNPAFKVKYLPPPL